MLCGGQTEQEDPAVFYTREGQESLVKPAPTWQRLCNTLRRQLSKQSERRQPYSETADSETADSETAVLFTAVALRDRLASPYDREALPFRRGDLVAVTKQGDTGTWRGRCRGREGTFKFVDVRREEAARTRRRLDDELISSSPSLQLLGRATSVQDLLSSINLENLIPVFVLNGFESTDSVRKMSEEDLEYLGISDPATVDVIIGTVDWLNCCDALTSRDADSAIGSSVETLHTLSDESNIVEMTNL